MDMLRELNPQQQQAVTAGTGAILVLAGPGSGKTRVLTQRIAYLIGYLGVRPYHILAVTFTNKAAREMDERIGNLLGERNRGLTLGTFHSICGRILRREAQYLPFDPNYVIFDADDQIRVVKQVVKDLNLNDKLYRPHGIHGSISRAKNELLFPDDFPVQTYRDEVVKRVYERYQKMLLASNALDFDDMLLWTAYLLGQMPAVRERYARRYEHILVDEFQDTNMVQYTLLKHLASFHQNIFVVGDADQSIYRWRGADYRNVLRFEEDYPDSQVILLEQNYRSTQTILDTAMAVIDQNPKRTPKKLFTERGDGRKITLRELYDDREMAAFLVGQIAKDVAAQKNEPGDFAVMYRTNAQSRILEEAFLAAGFPYKLVGAQRFYGRREVKDVIAYLRLVYNPRDEISLMRVINTPRRGIGDKSILTLRTYAGQQNLSPGEIVLQMGLYPDSEHGEALPNRVATSLAGFGRLLSSWHTQKDDLTPMGLMDLILGDIDYRTYLEDGTEEGKERWENVMELRRLASEYENRSLEAFLENIALVSDQDTLDDTGNVPTLLTLHAAKGLEFPVVFIIGLNDGTLPHIRSFEDPEAMHEERRLLYVGITRAEDQLYLLYALNRFNYGYMESADPSRYLEDIPLELVSGAPARQNSNYGAIFRPERWDASEEIESVEQQYHPGMNVNHAAWGDGMVLNSKIEDHEEIVDIFFEDVGLKRVVASLARLEIKP
ncbi:MAG: UvrD-helicase domain-containing protein [Anaerolineales bacterium]|nr:UvrD-helicase domain-containing protein [Anaerolineales bacterium]